MAAWKRQCVAMVLVLAAVATGLRAQSGTGLEGVVTDSTGGAVAGAAVVVRNDATGDSRALVTDTAGHYGADGLAVGSYTIEVTQPGFALQRREKVPVRAGQMVTVDIKLGVASVTEEVTVSGQIPAAAQSAPSQGSLTARSAQSIIGQDFIDKFTSPVADFTQVLQASPGTFSFAPNGVGLGDSKTFFRGFSDGAYTMTFDGIPFEDSNSPTHHSWAFFPSQFTGGAVVDRSPGSAATLGPANYGGSMGLLSRKIGDERNLDVTFSGGSFSTRLLDVALNSGPLGDSRKSSLLFDIHQMTSDGYQTFNHQKRIAFDAKYQYAFSDRTALTFFAAGVDLRSNTPNAKGATRDQLAQNGNNYLLSADPTAPNYYGFNFYHVPTDFEYVGLKSALGHGWSLDNKTYTYRYYNAQNYNDPTKITTTSAVDKLNSYRRIGNILPLTQVSVYGTLRTGLWSEYSWSDRYQVPSDPRTWQNTVLPNFHETFGTTIIEPYVEYQIDVTSKLKITPGIKKTYYKHNLTQFADNGKTVGDLGGAASVTHDGSYGSWLPSFDVHYLARPNMSVYLQAGKGDTIPLTSTYDVKNGAVSVLPDPTRTKSYQIGEVFKSERATLDADVYYIRFENAYSSFTDNDGSTVWYANGVSVAKGLEVESNVSLGRGVNLYLNATKGSAVYADTKLWVDSAPTDTQTISPSYQRGSWDLGLFVKRVSRLFNDNGAVHEAVRIPPVTMTNLFVNYSIRHGSSLSRSKVRLAVNNLFDKHNVTSISPATKGAFVPSGADVISLLAGRSVSLTFTVGLSAAKATP